MSESLEKITMSQVLGTMLGHRDCLCLAFFAVLVHVLHMKTTSPIEQTHLQRFHDIMTPWVVAFVLRIRDTYS